jgi:hypothetical protein
MFALHVVPHHLGAFRALVVMLAAAGLIFWRTAFKIIIGTVIIFIALGVAAFALGFAEGMYHFIR